MKPVLVVSTRSKQEICGRIWQGVAERLPLEWRVVEKERDILPLLTPLVAGHDYSRVVIDANLRRLGSGIKRLRGLSDLVLFDHDICQELVPESDWFRRYVPVIKYIGAARVIVSGAFLCDYLRDRGIDAVCIAKAYNPDIIEDRKRERDIDIAFVGRLGHRVYRQRRRILSTLDTDGDVKLLRSEPGEPYNALLNRIRVFVSADVGFNEYMIKNFEAMAAGCALVAWRQPESEQRLLSVSENRHLFLYDSVSELKAILARLRHDRREAEAVALAGRDLVSTRHQWRHRVDPMIDALVQEFRPVDTMLDWRNRLRLLRL